MAEAPRVFVAGATSAIAQAVARLLAARGARFFLVARDAARLEAVAADLRARGAAAAALAVADLDDLDRHGALADEALAALGGIDIALLAQGTLPDAARCEASFAEARAAIHTNFVGVASLAAALASRMEGRGRATIAALGSVAGDRGRRSNYVYGAAKGALAIYLDGLRHRLHGTGVNVLTVKPGFVDTPMTRGFAKGPLWASPERVASGIVNAIDRGARVVYVPWFWRPIMAVVRAIPERIFLKTRL
jgi:short-subunit dehydrogenase